MPRSIAPKTRDDPRSGCIKTKNQGIKETNIGFIKWDKSENLFLSKIEAKTNIKVIFANSEGCKFKPAKVNHLWAPRAEVPLKFTYSAGELNQKMKLFM